MDNLEKSELVISRIMQLLAEIGLQRSMLDFESLELGTEFEPFFETSTRWLLEEGVIRCTHMEQVRRGAPLVNPVITAYGFSLLGQRFIGASAEKSLGEALKEVSAGEAQYSKLGSLIGGVLGGFTKSVS